MNVRKNMFFKRSDSKKYEYRTNVFLSVLIVISILGIVLSVVAFRRAVKNLHTEDLQVTTQRSAQYRLHHATTLLNALVDDLDMAASLISNYDDFEDPEILKILQYTNKSSPFGFIGVSDPEGNAYDDMSHKVNIADRKYFQSAMNGQVGFSEVMESKVIPDETVQIIAHPIRTEEDTVKGVVYGVLHISDIEKLGIRLEGNLDDNIYVIDSCGKYIAQFRENMLIASKGNFWNDMENSSLSEEEISHMREDFETRKSGDVFYTYGDSTRYACYMPVGPNKWQIVYSVSTSSMDHIVHSLYHLDNREGLFAGVCYIVLMICVVWRFKRLNNEVRKAHRETGRVLGYMRIALEHSNYSVFSYTQENKTIQLKTDFQNCLLDRSVISGVPESIISRNLIAPESKAVFENLFETIKTEGSCEGDIRVINDGQEIWYRVSMNNIYDRKSKRMDTVGVMKDVSVEKYREAEAKRRFQLHKTLITNALEYGIVDLSTDTIVEWNETPRSIPYQASVKQAIQELVSEEYIPYVEKVMSLDNLRSEYQKGTEFVEVQYPQKHDGRLRWVSVMIYRIYEDDSARVMYVITDIDSQKRKELRLRKWAERDGLTELYNAITTQSKINEVLSYPYQKNENHVFILIDLDNYKQINDTFGHSYGDKVLKDVACILSSQFRSSDIIGRIGGDEFVILLRDMRTIDYAEQLIENLNTLLHRTYQDGYKSVTISASIGVAVAPQDGSTFQELYQKADEVQYQVKKQGKNGFRRYEPE